MSIVRQRGSQGPSYPGLVVSSAVAVGLVASTLWPAVAPRFGLLGVLALVPVTAAAAAALYPVVMLLARIISAQSPR